MTDEELQEMEEHEYDDSDDEDEDKNAFINKRYKEQTKEFLITDSDENR
jgi:hypothetical protein